VQEVPLVNLIGATVDDARDIMVEGESGIMAVCPRHERPNYVKSARKLVWPNGATSLIFTADEPDRLRGKQHMRLWGDEAASWRYPDALDQAMLGLRLGPKPRMVLTTTPRPTPTIRNLMAASTTVVTRGTTFDNRANLAPAFFDKVIAKYEGTRLGRQEVYAEILEDNPGALWKRADIDASRVTWLPPLLRVVVAIDPAMTSTEGSDQTGIVVAGLGRDRQFYVLDDVSLNGTPKAWAEAAIAAYAKNKADRIVAEVNNGGEMVEATLRTVNANVPYRAVHASRGKSLRAEPISALYEQHKVHHLGTFAQLEDQMCQWQPGDAWSPDRLDALVWALTELGGADLNSISVQEY
jgi:phage terminase large subunit-like protein